MLFVPRRYKQDKLAARYSPASKAVNTEVEGSTELETVTRQRLVKTQQDEKT
jgi:hypothetical protein